MTSIPFTNFTKGELAPELQARIDTSQYSAGARKVRNFIIQRYGGLMFRPGFRFVMEADSPLKKVRLVPFQYNIEQSYVVVLEDKTMRLLARGGAVVEQNLKITAITKAANAKVTAAFHSYVVGDRVYFSGIVGMTELNGRVATVVSVVDANNFTIDVNSTGFTAFTSSDGDTRTGAPTAPPAAEPPPAAPAPAPAPPPTTGMEGPGPTYGNLPQRTGVGTKPLEEY